MTAPAYLTRERAVALYGDPGHGAVASPAWAKASIVYCHGDGRETGHPSMPGVDPHFWFAVHRLVEPHMRRAFYAAQQAAPHYEIARAGCWVFRHQRHDVNRPLSNHSWGAAVDIDAATNSAHDFGNGPQPAPWSGAWMERWPRGLPRAFVEAFESCGFAWGGRWSGYVDPMHLELVIDP